ncbi:MAG TPA: site-specific integrase [Thermoanaerobaculia bacterium]|nr:site-specific integrase [Thermoanaerobaculia bacterium]
MPPAVLAQAEMRGAHLVGYGRSHDVPLAPLQYPSLEHLDAAVRAAIDRREELQSISPMTAAWAHASYKSFRRFLAAHEGRRRFLRGDLRGQVTVLEDWIIAMRVRGMQRGGINTTWRGLMASFRWLTRASGTVNPLRFVDAPKAGRPSVSFLTREAAEEVWRFVRNRLWRSEFERSRNTVIIGLMLLAGLRRGEVIRLRRGDVTVATGALLLRGTKGRDGGRTRMAHMPPQLRVLMGEYIEFLRELPPRRHPELLTSERNAPLSTGTITRLCTIISRESGIEVAPHMLRHSYATLLRQSGIPDRIAMELMGHADLRMLLRYSHVEAEEPRRAAEQLRLEE